MPFHDRPPRVFGGWSWVGVHGFEHPNRGRTRKCARATADDLRSGYYANPHPSKCAAAVTAWAAQQSTCEPIRIDRRDQRSAHTPPASTNTTIGQKSVAEAWASTPKLRATVDAHDQIALITLEVK